MSLNIVDLVKGQMTNAVLEKAGGLLGNDASKLAGGLDSVIPALLGGLTGAGNAPGKAGALFDAVNSSDDGIFGDFAGALGGSNSNSMIEQGSNALSGLMGSGMMGGLGSILSSVTGMSRGGTGSLMGMLAPVIFGVLKKQVLGGGMDAGGLMSMLNGQKANVANAMPANLRSQLGGIDGFPSFDDVPGLSGIASGAASSVGGAVSGAASSVGNAASGAVGSVSDAASGAVGSVSNAASGATGAAAAGVETAKSSGGGFAKILIPVLGALGLGWVAFTFLGKGDADVDVPDVSGVASLVLPVQQPMRSVQQPVTSILALSQATLQACLILPLKRSVVSPMLNRPRRQFQA